MFKSIMKCKAIFHFFWAGGAKGNKCDGDTLHIRINWRARNNHRIVGYSIIQITTEMKTLLLICPYLFGMFRLMFSA